MELNQKYNIRLEHLIDSQWFIMITTDNNLPARRVLTSDWSVDSYTMDVYENFWIHSLCTEEEI